METRTKDTPTTAARRGRKPSAPPQEERFNFRLAAATKRLLEQAAAAEGKNLKEFVQGAAIAEARRVLVEHSIIAMEPDERDAFLALLQDAPEPTPAARDAALRLRALRERGVLLPATDNEPSDPSEATTPRDAVG